MRIEIAAAELPGLLDRAPDQVSLLSLDCFDTVVWRDVQAPADIFAELPIAGGGAWARTRAEDKARKAARLAGRAEVTIRDIYRVLMPAAADAQIAAAIEAELAAEHRHCFAFAPTVALMRPAEARGLDIAIVSDTYLDEARLRALIAATAGADVLALIDRVFCSSAHGRTKATGLFEAVLSELGVAPGAILHVGDNPVADRDAPAAL